MKESKVHTKFITLISTAASGLLLLAACGGGTAASTSTAPAVSSPAAKPATSAPASSAPAVSAAASASAKPSAAAPASSTSASSAASGQAAAGALTSIKIACMGPQTGDLAFIGKPSLDACQMAADDFNAKNGGINGVKVQIVADDTQAKPDQADNLAKQAGSDPTILGLIGPMTSGATLAVGPTLNQANLAFITQSASNPKITQSGWKVAHRVVARDDEQGPADATFLAGAPVNAKNIYVVDSKEPYSVGLADQFQKKAAALGIKTERDGVAMGGKDYSAIVTKVKAANPDALFLPNQGPTCPLVLQEMRKQGAKFKFMSSDGCHDPGQMIKDAQGAGEGMYVSDIGASFDATPEGQAWGKAFKAKFGQDPATFASYAYDATNIMILSIQNAAKAKGGLNITKADVNQQVSATKNYKGLLTTITFDANGDIENAAIYIYQVVGQGFKQVKVVQSGTGASASGAASGAAGGGSASAKPSAS